MYKLFLRGFGAARALTYGVRVHNHLDDNNVIRDIALNTELMVMYIRCGDHEKVVDIYEGIPPASHSLSSHFVLFSACGKERALQLGMRLQGLMELGPIKKGDIGIQTALLNLYSKCSHFAKGTETWRYIVDSGLRPTTITFSVVLTMCSLMKSLELGKQAHALIVESNITPNNKLESSLITMYTKCGQPHKGIEIWRAARASGVPADSILCGCALRACVALKELAIGEEVHRYIINNVDFDAELYNALIHMYVECGKPQEAPILFADMTRQKIKPTIITCTTMLKACTSMNMLELGLMVHKYITESRMKRNDILLETALMNMYVSCGQPQQAFGIWDHIQTYRLTPTSLTYKIALVAAAAAQALDFGKMIHVHLSQSKVFAWKDLSLVNSLMNMYMKCGQPQTALVIGKQMQANGIQPDQYTYNILLTACADMADLDEGKQVHASIVDSRISLSYGTLCALINMYAKAGSLEDACSVSTFFIPRTVLTHEGIFSS